MFSREKFNQLTKAEKDILSWSIGYPDYDTCYPEGSTPDATLYNELNRCWAGDVEQNPNEYIAVVSKLI